MKKRAAKLKSLHGQRNQKEEVPGPGDTVGAKQEKCILIGGSYYQLHASNKQRNKSSKPPTFSDCCRLVTDVQAAAPIRHQAEFPGRSRWKLGVILQSNQSQGRSPERWEGVISKKARGFMMILTFCTHASRKKHFFFFFCAVE